MRRVPILLLSVGLAFTAALARPAPARSDEPALMLTALLPGDPCAFYRGQANGRGLAHFATEMLWACEEITARLGAEMPLGDRLLAAAAALDRYRAAVIAEGRAHFRSTRAAGYVPTGHSLDETARRALAETSGALAALDLIRGGY